jgi:hypothetical protein
MQRRRTPSELERDSFSIRKALWIDDLFLLVLYLFSLSIWLFDYPMVVLNEVHILSERLGVLSAKNPSTNRPLSKPKEPLTLRCVDYLLLIHAMFVPTRYHSPTTLAGAFWFPSESGVVVVGHALLFHIKTSWAVVGSAVMDGMRTPAKIAQGASQKGLSNIGGNRSHNLRLLHRNWYIVSIGIGITKNIHLKVQKNNLSRIFKKITVL